MNVGMYAQQTQWQETKHAVQAESDLEITGKDGVIVVRTTKRIQVRVFTILGQMVSQAVLNAGTSELKINSRGIYICKSHECINKCRNFVTKDKFNTKLSLDNDSMLEVLLNLENELEE